MVTCELGGRLAAVPPAAAVGEGASFEVQLGPEQRLFGPNSLIDTPFFSERDASGKLVGFSGNAASYEYDTNDNTRIGTGRVILTKGARGTFDGCGAWMSSIYKVPVDGKPSAHWVGWYHAESAGSGMDGMCNYANMSTVWRVAYVESWNSGRTWSKPSYPDNKVITQDTGLTGPITGDAGNPRVIAVGNYLYLFYQASTRDSSLRLLNVARAPVSSLGRPGSWSKYYCTPATDTAPQSCGFTEPGIGGRSTGLSNIAPSSRFVIWNSYLGRFIAPAASGLTGFSIRAADPTTADDAPLSWGFASSIYPPVSTSTDPTVDDWTARDGRSRQIYAYPSFLGADGSSAVTGQSFYVYYMKIFPGDGFDQRNLFRRKVSLVSTSSVPYNRVQLTTYVDADGRRLTSTEQPRTPGAKVVTSAGYLLAVYRPGWNPVFSCTGTGGDTFLNVGGCAGRPAVRRVGWLSPKATTRATVPIYRCYDARLARHFASTSATCAGTRQQGVLGYGLPALA